MSRSLIHLRMPPGWPLKRRAARQGRYALTWKPSVPRVFDLPFDVTM
jgi:hypothetical protein